MIERNIAATTHGRYLLAAGVDARGCRCCSSVFTATPRAPRRSSNACARFQARIDGRWSSIQGLHRFYQRRTNEVIASWMTRQDRELAIADNLAYVDGGH